MACRNDTPANRLSETRPCRSDSGVLRGVGVGALNAGTYTPGSGVGTDTGVLPGGSVPGRAH